MSPARNVLLMCIIVSASNTNAGWFGPDNYWECILDNLRNVHNDTIAEEAVKFCKDMYPFHERIFTNKKRPWFGIKTASRCVLKYGKNVKSELGAKQIQSACYKLYPDE